MYQGSDRDHRRGLQNCKYRFHWCDLRDHRIRIQINFPADHSGIGYRICDLYQHGYPMLHEYNATVYRIHRNRYDPAWCNGRLCDLNDQ